MYVMYACTGVIIKAHLAHDVRDDITSLDVLVSALHT